MEEYYYVSEQADKWPRINTTTTKEENVINLHTTSAAEKVNIWHV